MVLTTTSNVLREDTSWYVKVELNYRILRSFLERLWASSVTDVKLNVPLTGTDLKNKKHYQRGLYDESAVNRPRKVDI